MRTAILVGALMIAESINKNFIPSDDTVKFIGTVICFAILMDLIEFVHKVFKK